MVADEVSDEALSLPQLGSRIIALAGRVAAATCRWLLLVAEFDACGGAEAFGLASTTRWLGHHCGISARTARDHLRVARVLAAFPVLAGSMSAGRVCYSHVRAIARVVAAGEEELVAQLLVLAEHGTVAQLESMVAGLRTVDHLVDDPIVERTRQQGQTFSAGWEPDSRWGLRARLDPDNGAVVAAALDAVRAAAPAGERLSGAEALTRMGEITLAALADSTAPPRGLRGHERAAVVIHLEAGAVARPGTDPAPGSTATGGVGGSGEPRLDPRTAGSRGPRTTPTAAATTGPSRAGGAPEPPTGDRTNGSREPRAPRPYARIQDGPGLPAHVIERLACCGRIRTVLHGTTTDRASSVLDLGRSARVVTDRQFRALLLRDGGCAHPGCTSTWQLEAHHVRHWLHGGSTDMDNLVILCGAHHTAHHQGEFTIAAPAGGQFQFLRHGATLAEYTDPSTLFTTLVPVEDEHPDVADDAAGNRWGAERMDRSWAVSVLATNRYGARNQQRATSRPA